MKKPILVLKKGSDLCKLLLCLLMSLSALMLFYLPEDSITVFSDGRDSGVKGLLSLVKAII